MSNVTLGIGGRSFVVACAAGEEEHVTELARGIDAKLGRLGDMAGQSESRMLLFAALLLADELHERENPERDGPPPPPEDPAAALAGPLAALAERLENLATALEHTAAVA